MGTQTTHMDDERLGLRLNSKHETKKPRQNTKVQANNTKCVKPNYKSNIHYTKVRKHKFTQI